MHYIFRKIRHDKSGQSAIIVAIAMMVLLGFAAFAVDIGYAAHQKSVLQNAADSAALAGAQDLPSASTAKATAKNYATKNGVELSMTTATTPYNGNSKQIKVVCSETVSYTFARVLGFSDTVVYASAVAENPKWDGDALPFINLDGNGEDSTIGQSLSAWNMVSPGDKERIHNDDIVINNNVFNVNYNDGFIEYQKGKVLSEIRAPLENVVVIGNIVYLFSLKHSEMPNYAKKGSKELKEKSQIPMEDTVLLKCEVTDGWNGTAKDLIDLKFIDSYLWDASKGTYISITGEEPGGSPKLVE